MLNLFKRTRLKESAYDVASAPDADFRSLLMLPRDLDTWTHRKQLEYAYKMSLRNPLARRILELIKDHIIGGGITFEANDSRVFSVLDSFWNDPVNLLDMRQHSFAYELGLYGEQCYQVFVDKRNGRVRLGYIDPADIDQVIVDKENVLRVNKIKVKKDGQLKEVDVINLDENERSETFGYLVGDCFFFAINKVSNATRGTSDLLSLIDWLHGLDRYMFALLERAVYMNNYVWDVTLEGASKKTVDDFLKKFSPPKAGTVLGHNERIKYDLIVPKLEHRDQGEGINIFRNHILAGAGLPPFWAGPGDQTTRATALMMGDPTYKMLKARQDYFKYMFEYMFRFVIDQAIIAGTLPKDVDKAFQVIMPEISTRDVKETASALNTASTSLSLAETSGWISKEEASRVYEDILGLLGVRLAEKDASEEEETAELEKNLEG